MLKLVRKPLIATLAVAALAGGVAVAQSTAGSSATHAAKPVHLEEATMIIEVNATDGDAGLQVFLDGEAWKSMTITDPNGRRILDVGPRGRLGGLGLTELFSESEEPTFRELPLAKFKRKFPEGRYRFVGKTADGRKLVGSAKFSHDTPPGPNITAPAEGAVVAPNAAVASWDPVSASGGIEISGYRAIVERENPLRTFQVELPASAHGVTIPAEYLEPDTKYKLEVQAIERSGNQTISELEFRTAP
jgi:hypothetical protein